MKNFSVKLISSEEVIFEDKNVTMLTLPGVCGEFTVLADHAPCISALKAGNAIVATESQNTVSLDILDHDVVNISPQAVVIIR